MNLPIRTLRQKVAAINRRLFLDRRDRISLNSWMTRHLAMFIANGYWVEGDNPALREAQTLAYDKIEEAQLKESALEAERVKFDFDPENPPEVDVNPGTFERFLGSMGAPERWAGRG